MKKIPIIPECYRDLPDSTNLSAKEVARMFGYKTTISLSNAEKNNLIPPRDKECIFSCPKSASGTAMMKFWKLGTIRKWGNNI